MESERFRISVDLGRYFQDVRALSYMRVQAARRVRWLAARLARRWRLQGRFALVSRGHMLPPNETLALLRPDDRVEVIPWCDDWFINDDDVDTASEDMSPVRKQQMEEDVVLVKKQQKIVSDKRNTQGNEHSGYNNHTEIQNEILDDKAMEKVLSRSPVTIQSDSDTKLLEESKRSALALLEQCAPALQPTDAPDGAAPRRRRRVRRRVRRAPQHHEHEHDAQGSGSERAQSKGRGELTASNPAEHPCGSREECKAAVLRNGVRGDGARIARIVRPLHELTHGDPPTHYVPEKCDTS